ncbi:MAG TPA: M3 family metallopeptidase, partial [Polyangiaceae bacterium]
MRGSTLGSAVLSLAIAGCASAPKHGLCGTPTPEEAAAWQNPSLKPKEDNPFLQPSPLLLGMPPFDQIKDASYRPAFEAGMAEQRREITAIADSADAASFENTIVALERSGRILYRVSNVFFNLQGANTDPELDAIATEIAPQLSEHSDAILLDPKLFARVKALHDARDALKLDPESAQLLQRTYLSFVRAGANCSPVGKDLLRQINGQLSSLATQFQQNVLKATKDAAVSIDDVAELAGLSEPQLSAAATAAKTRGLSGKWLIPLQNTTIQPPLAQLQNRALRERIYRASIARASSGDTNNIGVVARIVALRAERAVLLGYPNHAAWVLADETAGTTSAVNKMLSELVPPAVANAKKEAADIQALIDKQAQAKHEQSFKLEPWDWAFYSEQVRKARYAYDESETKPYFELNQVLQGGVFYAATQLYGVTFKELHDLPVYRPEVRSFEVFDADGSPLGLFIADYYARDNKNGGAWENQYLDQSRLFGTRAVVANHLNIPKPAEGQPTLLTFDEVTTLFHEFGHALHALLS